MLTFNDLQKLAKESPFFSVDARHPGTYRLFAVEQCECCGKDVMGVNSVNVHAPASLLLMAGFKRSTKPQAFLNEELGASDTLDGLAVCPTCYAQGEKDAEAQEAMESLVGLA